jgi:hypothetical protein
MVRTTGDWIQVFLSKSDKECAEFLLHDMTGYPSKLSKQYNLHFDNDCETLANAIKALRSFS